MIKKTFTSRYTCSSIRTMWGFSPTISGELRNTEELSELSRLLENQIQALTGCLPNKTQYYYSSLILIFIPHGQLMAGGFIHQPDGLSPIGSDQLRWQLMRLVGTFEHGFKHLGFIGS